MKEKLSEKEFDRVAGALVRDFSLDEAELESIADSADLRRGVRLAVADLSAKKSRRGWLSGFGWMTPVFGALLIGVCFGALALALMLRTSDSEVAAVPPVAGEIEAPAVAAIPADPVEAVPVRDDESRTAAPEIARAKNLKVSLLPKNRPAGSKSASQPRSSSRSSEADSDSKEERLTDFIALSYAGKSESGQIVRVKVPSAMMVTLGVVSEVRNSTELVSADVVVGDDGLARAIRFVK